MKAPLTWIPLLFLAFAPASAARAVGDDFPWTVLTPQNDSRDPDVRDQDEFESQVLIANMNRTEDVFHHHLVWSKIALRDLLSTSTSFCELRFDAVKPLVLTDEEKSVLHEYFKRGGFVVLQEDCYPYGQDEFWAVHDWPVIDFLTKELPAADPDFTTQRVDDSNQLFHQVYNTQTAPMARHELTGNPSTPNRTVLLYHGHICAFVFGRYNVIRDGKWIAKPRPFARTLNLEHHGYELTVNLYVYVMMH